ncbi:GYDIA family GHMP kinase [Salinimicrobium flavum]|uniref:GYDIA family GHMP kinase n=1 Tax=Salinimicrobium flavum TaxID=1737065 RepID=A0ABW5ITA9_9FLAO
MHKFYSHGKLLITGEYVVLDGATALALPARLGQSLEVKKIEKQGIEWTSYNHEGEIWFEARISSEEILGSEQHEVKNEVRKRLVSLLREAAKKNPEKLSSKHGFEIITRTEFPLDWGLGSSSSLVANIAAWFEIDAYELQEKIFGGSGYDIAVALENSPVTYELTKSGRSVLTTSFDPPFSDQLFFVHLNRKQNSRESIDHYRKQPGEDISAAVEKISMLTHQVITCTSLTEFELLIEIHETIISKLVNLPKIKSALFPDFKGAIKSLGGWGGDFILATGGEDEKNYFREKGYKTILSYSEMIF